MKTVLTIAGSDCSGGAGIQADIKTMIMNGVYAMSAITALTAQNTTGVYGIQETSSEFLDNQLDCIFTDIFQDAVKIGMLSSSEIMRHVASKLRQYQARHIVLDPVMVSTSGHKLIEDDAIAALTDDLMPLTSLITPNLREAEVLTDHPINNVEEMKSAALELLKFGCKAVLLKGGHLEGGLMCDVLQIAGESTPHLFTSTKIESPNTHGTGCTLSSAIATFLALGYVMPQAVERAKRYVTHGIEAGKDIRIGEGHGPLNHFYHPVPMNIKEE